MKMKYKLLAILAITLVAPSLTFGVGVKSGANFCENLNLKLDRYGGNVQTRLGNYEARKGEQLKKVVDNRAKADAKRNANRLKADEVRSGYLKQLEERATTTAQKEALAEFKKIVEQLATTKRQELDKSVVDYRSAIDNNLTDRQTAVVKAQAELKTAVDTAIAKAKADCLAGVDQAVVRKETMKNIQEAQAKFRDSVKGLDKVRNTIGKQAETQRTAIDKIQDSFRSAYQEAWQKLKNAFGS